MMPNQTTTELFKEQLLQCLDETFQNTHGIYLDKGTSLFETLDGVSAADASRSIEEGRATIAAQVEHVRFYLDVLNDVMQTEEVAKVNWREIWESVREVTPEEWEAQKQRVRESHQRVLATINEKCEGEYGISGALAILAHTAYHLGGIRQTLGAIRSRPAMTNNSLKTKPRK
jgi:hypothetical protein